VKAVGFDADGVLLDSMNAAWRAAERTLRAFGVAANINSPEKMERAFGHVAQDRLVGPQHAAMLRQFHRLIMRQSAASIGLFHEALAVVERLPPPRILVTAALADGVAISLGGHARLFDEIVGFETGRKPELLAQFAPRLRGYVTDTACDISDCKALGIPVIGCCWGYDTLLTIEMAGPDAIAGTPAQLFTLINNLTTENDNEH
jgi:phosphoglycolate phosphatase-like HAD superfamily hydrolase